MEDSFFVDQDEGDGFRMIQVHYVQAHLLLCILVPSRPALVLVCGPEAGDL